MKARLRRSCWAILLAAALTTAGAGTHSARAAYPGAQGKIAFESTVTGNLEIFVMNADGTGATNVTNDAAAADTDPVWSPDGSKIAFVKNCGAPCGEGHPNIFVMNADGSGAANLTPGPFATGTPACPDSNGGSGINPSWSPDGSKIAYATNGEIMVMNADGTGKFSATCTSNAVAAETQPAWGVNGQIAYIRASDIWAMNGDGSGQHPLTATTAGEQNPDWSPAATKLVYNRGGEIWTANADGTAQTAIVSGAGKTGALPAWSPDGTKIVFGSNAFTAPNGYDIFVMNPDGTAVTRLAGSVPAIDTDPNWQPVATAFVPALSIGDAAVTEGNAGSVAANFIVTLSAPSSQSVTVNFATANGSATAPADYTSTAGTLTFAPGQTSQTITVPVTGDTLFELEEKFFVNLSGSTNATILDAQGRGAIRNDDPKPSLTIGDVSLAEGNSGTKAFVFVIQLSTASGAATKVRFATADGTATVAGNDYAATAATVTIPAGATSNAITVYVTGDTLLEPDETFLVNLTEPANATIADPQAVGTIVNDD